MADPCPCDSGLDYDACCGRYIDAGEKPQTAEQLMRSRYTAYTLCNGDYLKRTWHPTRRPGMLGLDDKVRWLGLKVKRTEKGGPDDSDAIVEFVARYKIDGRGHRIHEVSRFVKEHGEWLYVDGEMLSK